MRPLRIERRWRTALLGAMLPSPGEGVPGLGDLDLRRFWARFDRSAPLPLRLGLRVATLALAVAALAPWILGRPRLLHHLRPGEWDALLHRAARSPLLRDLLLPVKVLACLSYFDDPEVQARVRGEGAG